LAALAVLVVACPCALGIATPMATTIALSRAAARGTLVRSGAALESLDRVRIIAFDKTGTITRGHPEVRRVRVFAASPLTEPELLALSASLEANVDHPFARAIVEEARERHIEISNGHETRSVPGGGAEGKVDGRAVLLGSRALLERAGISGAGPSAEGSEEESAVAVGIDGRLAGEIFLWDPPRPEARDVISSLRSAGMIPRLLSGDREAVVRRIARDVGVQDAYAYGGLAPAGKAELLQQWRQGRSLVAMVGDGVNDAPALAAADVGIAFGGVANLARQTADAVVLGDDLREVPRLVALSRRTMRIVRQNLVWAFGYNAIGILLAAFGFLTPVVAAAAMVLSSLCVVGNSLRLQRSRRDF
jgi:heavy metal translocating P-type ATPase